MSGGGAGADEPEADSGLEKGTGIPIEIDEDEPSRLTHGTAEPLEEPPPSTDAEVVP